MQFPSSGGQYDTLVMKQQCLKEKLDFFSPGMPSEHPLQSRVKSPVPNTCVIMIVMYHSSSTYCYYDFLSSLIAREFSSCFYDILQRILPFAVLDLAALVVSYGLVLQDCVQLNQYKLKDEIGKVRCILCMRVCV